MKVCLQFLVWRRDGTVDSSSSTCFAQFNIVFASVQCASSLRMQKRTMANVRKTYFFIEARVSIKRNVLNDIIIFKISHTVIEMIGERGDSFCALYSEL